VRFRVVEGREPPFAKGAPGEDEGLEPDRDFKERLATGAGVETFATLLPETFDPQS